MTRKDVEEENVDESLEEEEEDVDEDARAAKFAFCINGGKYDDVEGGEEEELELSADSVFSWVTT